MQKQELIILGDEKVGKTHLLYRFCGKNDIQNIERTVGVNMESVQCAVNGQTCGFRIIDTQGIEEAYNVTKSFMSRMKGAIIVFDLKKPETIPVMKMWVDTIKGLKGEGFPCVIIGNKSDAIDHCITMEEAQIYSKSKGFSYFECSALENTGPIKEALNEICQKVVGTLSPPPQSIPEPVSQNKCRL